MAIATLTVKLQAQIAEFQSEFKEATKATEKFQQEFQATATKASAYGNLIAKGIEFGVEAFSSLAKAALENASVIKDLSQQTGLTMKTIQQFQHVAADTGTTVDAFATAAFNLGRNLAGDNKSVVAGVDALGLSFKELRNLSPDEQFDIITTALHKMDDQQERNRLGVLLFGRTYKQIASAVDEDINKIKDSARIMSDDQVRRLADAENAWKQFGRTATIVSGEILASAMQSASRATASWSDFFLSLSPAGALEVQLRGVERESAASGATAPRAPSLFTIPALATAQAALFAEAADRTLEVVKPLVKASNEYAEVLKRIADAQIPLTESQREQVIQLEVLGIGHSDIAKALRVSDIAVRNYSDGMKKLNDLIDEQIPLLKRTKTEFEGLASIQTNLLPSLVFDDASAKALVQSYRDLFSDGGELARAAIDGAKKTGTAVGEETGGSLRDALAATAPSIISILGNALLSGPSDHKWEEVGAGIGSSIGGAIGAYFGGPAGQALGQVVGGAIGGWIGSLFDPTEYEHRIRDLTSRFRDMMADLGAIPAQAADLLNPERLVGSQNRNIGFFIFPDQADFDRLVHQFSIVGIQITEALRSGDPDFLQRVLDEGYAKTQLLNEAMKEYGFTWEHLGAEGRALQLGDLLNDLKAKTDVLIGAGVDELAVLMKQEAQYESLLLKAIATNTEIPESMRPLLDRMQELGLLTDDVTGEFIDLGQVEWSKTLTQGFKDVTDAIDRLTSALTGKAIGAFGELEDRARSAATGIEREFSNIKIPNIKIGVDVDAPRFNPIRIDPETGLRIMGQGGIVRRPTLALIGESGPEAVVPLSQLASVQGGTMTIVMERDGVKEAEYLVPFIPGAVRRFVAV